MELLKKQNKTCDGIISIFFHRKEKKSCNHFLHVVWIKKKLWGTEQVYDEILGTRSSHLMMQGTNSIWKY